MEGQDENNIEMMYTHQNIVDISNVPICGHYTNIDS